jgi:hypothetical protein
MPITSHELLFSITIIFAHTIIFFSIIVFYLYIAIKLIAVIFHRSPACLMFGNHPIRREVQASGQIEPLNSKP